MAAVGRIALLIALDTHRTPCFSVLRVLYADEKLPTVIHPRHCDGH
jgi:hypothetical protein